MLYFDTSFLVPLILEEPSSDAIGHFVAGLPSREAAISHWTRVEFASVLAREVRMGRYDRRAARDAVARFVVLVGEIFEVILPNSDDFDLAVSYLENHDTGLRGGDALHLAVAGNRRADAIYTIDKALLRAGKILGLPVSTGIELPGDGG